MLLFYSAFFACFVVLATNAGELRCLRPGAFVVSRYKDLRYFPGRVESLGESIDVTFDNGKQQSYTAYGNDVIVDDIPDVSELGGGSRVLARRPNSVSFEPGFINGTVEGLNDTYLVNYDEGDSIARNIADIRLATKPNNCMNEKGIYIGCFENVLNTYLTNYYPVNPTDVATCNWACFTRGFHFAGLQNGTWCFCGNHVNDSLKVDDNECNIACRDNREDVCGGYERMTIYWTGAESSDEVLKDDGNSSSQSFSSNTVDNISAAASSSNTENKDADCHDIYDSSQCNMWADAERCIKDPDWMIANCKKSCYACSYNENSAQQVVDQSSTSSQSSSPDEQNQAAVRNGYQSSSPSQTPNYDNEQSSYETSTNNRDLSTVKKSTHPNNKAANSASYLGCFKDLPSNPDLEYLADIKPLSIRGCLTKCKSMRFPYAGVQSSTTCYCGLHYGKYGEIAHEDCNMPCEADNTEMCGGMSMSSIYTTGFSSNIAAAENAETRTMFPSPPVLGDVTSRSLFPSPQSSTSYQSTSNQPSYTPSQYNQQNAYYNPYYSTNQVYSTYNQASNTQSNPSTPATSYATQATSYSPKTVAAPSQQRPPYSPPAHSPPAYSPPAYSPRDSSAYRWRESYVRLRAREQEMSAKLSKNLRKKSSKKLSNLRPEHERSHSEKVSGSIHVSGSAITSGVSQGSRTKKKAKSKTFSTPNSNKFRKNLKNYFRNSDTSHSGNHSVKALATKKISKKPAKFIVHNKKLFKLAVDKKHFGKPGVFLRKKSSKENSFLAFLPHEVTKDETLLENVYNMLSVMLNNLRKKQKNDKNSMKTLQKYLKLPGEEARDGRNTGEYAKQPKHEKEKFKNHQNLQNRTDNMVEKLKKNKHGPRSPAPLHHATSAGQKQPSNQFTQSRHSNQSNVDILAGKPSYIYRVIIRPETSTSQQAVRLPNNTKIGLNFWNNQENMSVNKSSRKYGLAAMDRKKIYGKNPHRFMVLPGNHRKQSENNRGHVNISESLSGSLKNDKPEKKISSDYSGANRNESLSHRVYKPLNQSKLNKTWNKLSVGKNVSSSIRKQSNSSRKPRNGSRGQSKGHRKVSRDNRKHNMSKQNFRVKEIGNKIGKKWKNGLKMSRLAHKKWKKKLRTSEEFDEGKKMIKIDKGLGKALHTNGSDEIFVDKSDEDVINTITKLLNGRKGKTRNKKYEQEIKKWSVDLSHKLFRKSRLPKQNKTFDKENKTVDNLMNDEQSYEKHFQPHFMRK